MLQVVSVSSSEHMELPNAARTECIMIETKTKHSSFRMPQYDPELPNRYAYYYFRQGGKAPECVSSRSLEGVYGQLTSGGNGDQSGDYKDKQSWIIEPVPYVRYKYACAYPGMNTRT